MSRKRARVLFFALAAVGFGTLAGVVMAADCTRYPDSRVAYIWGQNVCGYTGSGCSECVNPDGSSCVTNGSSCEPCGFTGDPCNPV